MLKSKKYDIKNKENQRGGEKMKSSEKKMIAILVAITIVVIIIAIIMNTSKTKESKKTEAEQTEKTIGSYNNQHF